MLEKVYSQITIMFGPTLGYWPRVAK